MAYEYKSKLLDYASDSKTYEEYKAMSQELQEVYRKAKAFHEILNITQLQHEEEYAEDVISVIDKYKEDE